MNEQANKQEKIQEVCNRLIQMFKSGQAPAVIARSIIQKKEGSRPSDSWSIGNRILMFLAGTEDARGYRQWEEVGRYVRKGAKAFYILAPCTKRVIEVKTITDQGKEQKIEEEKVIITGFRGIPVFRCEDTEGKPLPVISYEPKVLPPLYDVAVKLGVKVEWQPYSGREYGYCTVDGQKIVLKSKDVPVFFHELAHVVHGQFKAQKGGQHADQEIVAEMTAAVLSELYGYQNSLGNSWQYIRHYSEGDPNKAIRNILHVLSDVEKCVEIILTGKEEKKTA